MLLGSMGPPLEVDVNGQIVYICCEGCRKSLLKNSEKYLEILRKGKEKRNEPTIDPEVAAELAKLSPEIRKLVESQRICPVTEMLLGSMGPPLEVDVNGQIVYICCEGCRKRLLKSSKKYLEILRKDKEGRAQ